MCFSEARDVVRAVAEISGIRVTLQEVNATLKSHPDGDSVCCNCFNTHDFDAIANRPELTGKRKVKGTAEPLAYRRDDTEGYAATIKFWRGEYVGRAASCLVDTMSRYMTCGTKCASSLEDGKTRASYALVLSIVQSSGTGKSRMIDEVAKEHIVFPVNLRNAGEDGFPPADENARDFLINSNEDPLVRYHTYFTALFEVAKQEIVNAKVDLQLREDEEPEPKKIATLASRIREWMSAVKGYHEQGPQRRTFYAVVVERAQELLDTLECEDSSSDSAQEVPQDPKKRRMHTRSDSVVTFGGKDIQSSAMALLKSIDSTYDQQRKESPLVILAFDEAHSLAEMNTEVNSEKQELLLFALRYTLRSLHALPIFATFSSTTNNIFDFTPLAREDRSSRIVNGEFGVLPPFTEVGFDQLAPNVADGPDLHEVSVLGYMVKFGRPLWGSRFENGNHIIKRDIAGFAYKKLLGCNSDPTYAVFTDDQLNSEMIDGDLACLSVRIPLHFISTTTATRKQEQRLVSNHMRLCLHVERDLESCVTIDASEPILAEGARLHVTKAGYNLPRRLLQHLEHSGLDKGPRGELIALTLLTLACDQAWKISGKRKNSAYGLLDFIRVLLLSGASTAIGEGMPYQHRQDENKNFETTFQHSQVYFNHFIKVADYNVIKRSLLWKLIVRGAAILCADNQRGVDIIIPFLYRDSRLSITDVSAIFLQVKNDNKYSEIIKEYLFDAMDSFSLGFYEENEKNPLLVVRMVFALASHVPAILMKQDNENRCFSRVSENHRYSKEYTAFDIWLAKTSPETFGVISKQDEAYYSKLLQISKDFPKAYESPSELEEASDFRRNMNPGAASHPQHWAQF